MATMIEAPLDLQKSLTIPPDHFAACAAQGLPTVGNAAGNTKDLFDLTGENLPPPPLPSGFTAKGIVALIFSCISAVMGIAVIMWYGMEGTGASKSAETNPTEDIPLTDTRTPDAEGSRDGIVIR